MLPGSSQACNPTCFYPKLHLWEVLPSMPPSLTVAHPSPSLASLAPALRSPPSALKDTRPSRAQPQPHLLLQVLSRRNPERERARPQAWSTRVRLHPNSPLGMGGAVSWGISRPRSATWMAHGTAGVWLGFWWQLLGESAQEAKSGCDVFRPYGGRVPWHSSLSSEGDSRAVGPGHPRATANQPLAPL